MNCRDSAAIINGLARGQLFEASPRAEALAHTRRCARCAATLSEQGAVAAAVRAVVEDVSARRASPHVEEALRAAFRERHAAGAALQAVGARRRPRWVAAASAAAAILLLACTVGLLRQKSLRVDGAGAIQPAATASAPAATQDGVPAMHASSAHVEGVPEGPAARRRRTPRRSRGARRGVAVETEATTEFFLLTDDAHHVPLESGQVVRVELPLSSLVAAEASAGGETADRMVKADLVIGQDGLARAIRFVR